jgi:hypothetical protein
LQAAKALTLGFPFEILLLFISSTLSLNLPSYGDSDSDVVDDDDDDDGGGGGDDDNLLMNIVNVKILSVHHPSVTCTCSPQRSVLTQV